MNREIEIILQKPEYTYDTATLYEKERKHVYYILCPYTFKSLTKEIKISNPILAAKKYMKDNDKNGINYENNFICVYDIETSKIYLYYNNKGTLIPSGNIIINKNEKKDVVINEIYKNIKEIMDQLHSNNEYKSDFSDDSDYSDFSDFSDQEIDNFSNRYKDEDTINYYDNYNPSYEYDFGNDINRYMKNDDELNDINKAIEKLNISNVNTKVFNSWLMNGGRKKKTGAYID